MNARKTLKHRRAAILGGVGAITAGAAMLVGKTHIGSWAGDTKYPKGEPLPVDISTLPEGKLLTVNWQDKPVWILRRSAPDLATLSLRESQLIDPQSKASAQPRACRNPHRSLKPEIFVAVGLCTHQGCTPYLNAGKGFICPCHASHYDLAGRIFDAGPAPANLVIPAYRFASENQLVIGEEA